jgi:DNA polymerase-3 subunit delta
MKLSPPQLERHLSTSLAPLYLLSGDEMLLIEEARDLIQQTAQKQGFTETCRLHPDPGADWGTLLHTETHSLSLFATQRIIELDLRQAKLTQNSTAILKDYAKEPPNHTLLMILTAKLDKKTEQSAWYQAIEKKGVAISFWPIPTTALPAWIIQRAKKMNLSLTKEMAEFIAQQTEGNLFSAAQEIEKLFLLQSSLNQTTVEHVLTDTAHFTVFELVDSALSGNAKRTLRILHHLAEEEIEPTLILWALTRELRTLAEMIERLKKGESLSALFNHFRIFEKRQPAVRAFLQRHSREVCWNILLEAAKIDRIIKGAEEGNLWNELEKLVLTLTGNAILI